MSNQIPRQLDAPYGSAARFSFGESGQEMRGTSSPNDRRRAFFNATAPPCRLQERFVASKPASGVIEIERTIRHI